jgi:hypothetical protein
MPCATDAKSCTVHACNTYYIVYVKAWQPRQAMPEAHDFGEAVARVLAVLRREGGAQAK